ncbi:MAG: hypothetical protein HYR91_01205 [Flavobacteriia bacterium]|nr:hypothetical protein [Flavobacteriia bacterium]
METKIEITKNNIFEKIELLIEKKIEFKDVYITYEDLLTKFSKPFKSKFTKDGGTVMKTLLPKWENESKKILSKINAENDVKIVKTQLTLDKNDQELNAYSGKIMYDNKGENCTIGFSAFEINKVFYIIKLINFEAE